MILMFRNFIGWSAGGREGCAYNHGRELNVKLENYERALRRIETGIYFSKAISWCMQAQTTQHNNSQEIQISGATREDKVSEVWSEDMPNVSEVNLYHNHHHLGLDET